MGELIGGRAGLTGEFSHFAGSPDYTIFRLDDAFYVINHAGQLIARRPSAVSAFQAAHNLAPNNARIHVKSGFYLFLSTLILTKPLKWTADGAHLQLNAGAGTVWAGVRYMIFQDASADWGDYTEMSGFEFSTADGNDPGAQTGIICAREASAHINRLRFRDNYVHDVYVAINLRHTEGVYIEDNKFRDLSNALTLSHNMWPKYETWFRGNDIVTTDAGVFLADGDPIRGVWLLENVQVGGFAFMDINTGSEVDDVWCEDNKIYPIGDGLNEVHPVNFIGTVGSAIRDIHVLHNYIDGTYANLGAAVWIVGVKWGGGAVPGTFGPFEVRDNIIRDMPLRGVAIQVSALAWPNNSMNIHHNEIRNCLNTIQELSKTLQDIQDNRGYNPRGQLGNPYTVGAGLIDDSANAQAFPTSNTDYTIADSPKLISIYGGTVTNIQIDGVVTGLTSGIFRLMPRQVFKVVWTVQPNSIVWRV